MDREVVISFLARERTVAGAGFYRWLIPPAALMVHLSFYGGGFATIPAYLKDLFGVAEVGAIHGRLLTAWSAAGVAGPLIINANAGYQTSAGRTGADLYTL